MNKTRIMALVLIVLAMIPMTYVIGGRSGHGGGHHGGGHRGGHGHGGRNVRPYVAGAVGAAIFTDLAIGGSRNYEPPARDFDDNSSDNDSDNEDMMEDVEVK